MLRAIRAGSASKGRDHEGRPVRATQPPDDSTPTLIPAMAPAAMNCSPQGSWTHDWAQCGERNQTHCYAGAPTPGHPAWAPRCSSLRQHGRVISSPTAATARRLTLVPRLRARRVSSRIVDALAPAAHEWETTRFALVRFPARTAGEERAKGPDSNHERSGPLGAARMGRCHHPAVVRAPPRSSDRATSMRAPPDVVSGPIRAYCVSDHSASGK